MVDDDIHFECRHAESQLVLEQGEFRNTGNCVI